MAIKVQRPDILGRVALDMHLLRILSGPIKALAGLQTDLAGVIDDWYATTSPLPQFSIFFMSMVDDIFSITAGVTSDKNSRSN